MKPQDAPQRAAERRSCGLYVGIILIGANLRAPITSVGPVLPNIQASLHLGDVGAGVLNALPLLIFAFLSLAAPAFGQRHGLGPVLGAALVAILVGTLVRSSLFPGALWLGTGLLSVGIAFGNVLLPALAKRDFPINTAGLIGSYAAAMAGTAGLAAGPAVPIASIAGLDWRWSIGVWALLALGALLVWLPQWRAAGRQPAAASNLAERRSPWRHAIGWQVSLFFALHSLVFYSIVDWFASYAASAGVPARTAGVYLLIYQAVAIATNLGSAPLIRRFADQTRLGFVCGVFLTIGSAGLLLAPGLSWLWLISAGLGAGFAMVTSLSLFALRTHDHRQAAALSGMAQFIGYLGAAAGPLTIGVLHAATGGWNAPMASMVLASVLATMFAVLAGRDRFVQ